MEMVETMPLPNETVTSLAMALVESSKAPLLLLDDDVVVIGASASFCNTFNLDPATIANRKLADLGAGEWDVPQLNSLLRATIGGAAEIDAYEMDLVREGKATCRLILSAHKLDYFDTEKVRIVLAATDVTETRLAEKQKDDLIREKHVLLQELQNRVAKQPADHRKRAHAKRAPRSVRGNPSASSRRPQPGHVDCDASKTASGHPAEIR
jgi:hypothetical protein